MCMIVILPVEYVLGFVGSVKNNCRLSQKVMYRDIDRVTDYVYIMHDNCLLDNTEFNKFTTKPIYDYYDIMENSLLR